MRMFSAARFLPVLLAFFVSLAPATETARLEVDFAKPAGAIRALHGMNKGPLVAGGLVDLTAQQRALGVPLTRLHDCHWPNPDVVDMHAVFPNAEADPQRAESYDFARTDDYLAATIRTGAEVVYRLGESIEHAVPRRFVHPPASVERWAAVCCGIIAHCNDSWAHGAHFGIRYWEIWNEPENRPAMWSGTDDDYFALYKTTARAVKTRWPDLKVGGPAVGNPGALVGGELRPTEFVTHFLEMCRRDAVPLNFFSWHCYTDDPHELVLRTRGIRRLLDAHGFTSTESHLNEWNYLPGNSWSGISRKNTPEARQQFTDEMAGAKGAAFIAAALIELQDAPLDAANLFHGETGGFGIFTEQGVPLKNYHALRAFAALAKTHTRVAARGPLAIAAGLNAERSTAPILVSNFASDATDVRLICTGLPWPGSSRIEVRVLDASRDLALLEPSPREDSPGEFLFALPAPAIALITLRNTGGK